MTTCLHFFNASCLFTFYENNTAVCLQFVSAGHGPLALKLPYLGLEDTFRQELLDQHGMECVKAKHTLFDNKIFVLSNRRTFGLSESQILSSVHRCLKEMIAIENKFKDSAKT